MNKLINNQIKIASIALILAASALPVCAQRKMGTIELGIRVLPTFSAFSLKTYSGGTIAGQGTFGLGFGGLLAYHFSKNVAVQGEVIYNTLSQKYKESSLDRKVKLSYLNIPLLLSLNTDKTRRLNLNMVGGPQIGISVGSSLTTKGTDTSVTGNAILAVKKGDLGIAYGAGLGYGLNRSNSTRVSAGFRGVLGLLDVSDNNFTVNNNSYLILDKTNIKTYSMYIGLSVLL